MVVVLVSHNNQPGMVVTVPVPNNPHAPPLPTSVGKIGTTSILMVVTWRTPTQAHRVVSGAQHNAARTNIMGRSIAGMHKTILTSACGRTPPPPCRPQQQLHPQQHPPVSYYPVQGTTQPTYRACATMPMLAQQPGQGMMNFVGQQYSAPNAVNAQMMQQPAQQAMPMMAPYYAPNQQPYQLMSLTYRICFYLSAYPSDGARGA